mmetsp:Transcript_28322/g.37813  ORF Transcript_28322/g.37813 Transcript_28322/m.37813 type:complete len:92 (+) Transcript_28322:120-395(+)
MLCSLSLRFPDFGFRGLLLYELLHGCLEAFHRAAFKHMIACELELSALLNAGSALTEWQVIHFLCFCGFLLAQIGRSEMDNSGELCWVLEN